MLFSPQKSFLPIADESVKDLLFFKDVIVKNELSYIMNESG